MADYSGLASATNDLAQKAQALSAAIGSGTDQAGLTPAVKEVRKAHRAFRKAAEAAGFAPPADPAS
jgi:hypothetical protein